MIFEVILKYAYEKPQKQHVYKRVKSSVLGFKVN